MQRFNNKRSKTNQKLYDYRVVLTVYNILNSLDKHFTMQNGNATVVPAEKSPTPGIANWSPPGEIRDENISGGKCCIS
ncbi:hypothetical protein WA026_000859 [Henosepilachna vigintioctopunctata]|uniref:Guanine nucleotide-binding protein subunit gamma n=1 Tax=Henosepilachna vigintioctopunctata TaxID=420089 RepID=A0AAW1V8T4_9CUCU